MANLTSGTHRPAAALVAQFRTVRRVKTPGRFVGITMQDVVLSLSRLALSPHDIDRLARRNAPGLFTRRTVRN